MSAEMSDRRLTHKRNIKIYNFLPLIALFSCKKMQPGGLFEVDEATNVFFMIVFLT